MKVIGAGVPRTATLCQKLSLQTLGFDPTYHMVNVLSDMSLLPQWVDAFEGNGDWDTIFDGFEATVDWPGSFFYQELVETYPEAKVLLSVRDSDSWARSINNTMWPLFFGDNVMHHLSSARCQIDEGWRNYIEFMKGMWKKSGLLNESGAVPEAFERYNADVQETVPEDRLLVWNPADGWDPLCAFLEVPVPQEPVQRVNDSEMFADRIIDAALIALTEWQNRQALISQK